MKIFYWIVFTLCLFQLIIWLCMPYSGIFGIYDMMTNRGFYIDDPTYYPDGYTMAKKLGLSDHSFQIVNRLIAILYFGSLFITVTSAFFKVNIKYKVVIASIALTILSSLLLINWVL